MHLANGVARGSLDQAIINAIEELGRPERNSAWIVIGSAQPIYALKDRE
jgi:hypothetical protein